MLLGNSKVKDHFRDLGIDGGIISRCISGNGM
jgi:hypothetical protein